MSEHHRSRPIGPSKKDVGRALKCERVRRLSADKLFSLQDLAYINEPAFLLNSSDIA